MTKKGQCKGNSNLIAISAHRISARGQKHSDFWPLTPPSAASMRLIPISPHPHLRQ